MHGKIGCLIIHGFAGSVNEVLPLAWYFSKRGYITLCSELKGHTGRRKDLARVDSGEWIKSAEDGLLELRGRCDRVVLIGFSMGGLIAVNLANKYNVDGVVTLNTPVYYWDLRRVALNIIDDCKAWNFKNLKRYCIASFDKPFPALVNFLVLLNRTKKLFKGVNCPVFIGQSLKDDTTHYSSADYIYGNVGSGYKVKKYYNNSGHVICCSDDGNEVFRDVEDFIKVIFANT